MKKLKLPIVVSLSCLTLLGIYSASADEPVVGTLPVEGCASLCVSRPGFTCTVVQTETGPITSGLPPATFTCSDKISYPMP